MNTIKGETIMSTDSKLKKNIWKLVLLTEMCIRDSYILCKSVCGHCNNWDGRRILAGQGPNLASCFISIHIRHLYVHQDKVVIPFTRLAELCYAYRAIGSSLHRCAQ